MSEYNGYATWRVNLEFFDGYDPDGEPVTADSLESMVVEHIEATSSGFAQGLALAFIQDVNWNEIAEHINAEFDLSEDEETEDE